MKLQSKENFYGTLQFGRRRSRFVQRRCRFQRKNAKYADNFDEQEFGFYRRSEKIFAHDEIETQIYPVNEIKMYEGVPQVKAKSNDVEIYLKTKELEFGFQSKNEVYKFRSAIIKLLTGKTGFERGADKVKDKIDVVNDTFGVDVVKSTEDVVKNGIVESIGGLFEKVGKIGKAIFGKKK